MTIDKDKLRALAEVATPGPWAVIQHGEVHTEGYECNGETIHDHIASGFGCGASDGDDAAFVAAASPSTILALLGEIDYQALELECVERAKAELSSKLGCADEPRWKWLLLGADELIAERDQLKAENEALRKDAERYRWLLSIDDTEAASEFIGYACSETARQQIDLAMSEGKVK